MSKCPLLSYGQFIFERLQTSEVTNVIDLLEEFLIRLNFNRFLKILNSREQPRRNEAFSVVTGAHQSGPGRRRR